MGFMEQIRTMTRSQVMRTMIEMLPHTSPDTLAKLLLLASGQEHCSIPSGNVKKRITAMATQKKRYTMPGVLRFGLKSDYHRCRDDKALNTVMPQEHKNPSVWQKRADSREACAGMEKIPHAISKRSRHPIMMDKIK